MPTVRLSRDGEALWGALPLKAKSLSHSGKRLFRKGGMPPLRGDYAVSRSFPAAPDATHILLIGGESRFRALITFGARQHGIYAEPVDDLTELRLADWERADLVVAWSESAILDRLRIEMDRHKVWIPVIVCAATPTMQEIIEMVEDGVNDVLAWPATCDHLAERATLTLQKWDHRRPLMERAYRASGRLRMLTKREAEVIERVAKGMSNKQIGRELEISPRTVEIHRLNMLAKLQVSSSAEAVGIYFEASFAAPSHAQASANLRAVNE